ncbi:cellulose biosynthesis protein BcsG [soil metagenome]
MGYWSFYFFAKIGLYWANVIGFHVLPNLLFALVLSLPVPTRFARFQTFGRALAILVAAGLLWYDSEWPSPLRLIEQWTELSQFSVSYWLELLNRIWSWPMVGALLIGIAVHGLLMKRVRLGVVAIALMAVLTWLPRPDAVTSAEAVAVAPADPSLPAAPYGAPKPVTLAASASKADDAPLDGPKLDALLNSFYEHEKHRGLRLADPAATPPPFDLLILSVCSLSWDDLAVAGLDDSPLLRRMDLLFRQFNSAASYSGPAVLRLLHGTCGQTPQAELYDPAAPECYLFQQLDRMGYRSSLLLNHDGRYDGFTDQLKREGGLLAKAADHKAAQIALYGFDDSPIYDDYDVLSRWWRGQTDAASPASAKRFALLYNTVSLHDGNRRPGAAPGHSLQSWPTRARKLFGDIERMLALIEQSGRPTVVVLVPEHGAGLRGDNTQIPGLREFPTPRITHVPAGVALLNFGARPADAAPVMVDQVSSYNSLMAVIGALMQQNGSPFDTLKRIGGALPPGEWIAENAGTLVMSRDGRNYMRTKEGRWSE